MVEPAARRPHMPGYGILGADEGGGLLPWSWAEARLVGSRDYWVATVGADGAPHVMPVWGIWADGHGWFSSSPQSRKSRNIAGDQRVVITSDAPSQPVVVQGIAERVHDDGAIADFTHRVNEKYESDLAVSFFTANATFRVRPRVVFGLDEADFTGTPTRWEFDGGR
ncbi:MAG TPA: pyridoxamine 5'-phosphate oxidase family protein [Acidimicrobiales bacterium]|nr:pyridoxamine 5'-phosphate oxidase family protein [Acidimicrobiales bacterium]